MFGEGSRDDDLQPFEAVRQLFCSTDFELQTILLQPRNERHIRRIAEVFGYTERNPPPHVLNSFELLLRRCNQCIHTSEVIGQRFGRSLPDKADTYRKQHPRKRNLQRLMNAV